MSIKTRLKKLEVKYPSPGEKRYFVDQFGNKIMIGEYDPNDPDAWAVFEIGAISLKDDI